MGATIRIQSADIFRLIAVAAVIVIHTAPFRVDVGRGSDAYYTLFVLINQFARFAVPFFFCVSGYFWGKKVRAGEDPLQVSMEAGRKIFLIFAFWCVVYLAPYNVAAIYEHGLLGPIKVSYWHLVRLIDNPHVLIMQGTKIHLWFLVALLCSIVVAALFVSRRWTGSLLALSVAFYVFAVVGGAYAVAPFGLDIGFNTRNGPFFGTLFFVSGYVMSGWSRDDRWFGIGAGLFVLGCAAHFSELYVLWRLFEAPPEAAEFVFGTYFMGVGAAMMALSGHEVLRAEPLEQAGKAALGIYAVHFMYVDIFRDLDRSLNSPAWELGHVMLVMTLSVLSVFVLSRIRLTRRFVM